VNEGIENCYRLYIITSSFETEFTRKGQVVIVQIWKPKRVGKTFEEELKSWPMLWFMDTVGAASP
jgi:hypothetical protein